MLRPMLLTTLSVFALTASAASAMPGVGPANSVSAAAALQASTSQELVERIMVRGNQRIEPTTVVNYLGIKQGETISRYDIDLALKALYATGFFSDARISMDKGALLVDVQENPTINRVVFEGNESIDDEDLLGEVSLKTRGIYTRPKVQADVARLLERYRRSGHYEAHAVPKIIARDQNRVDLVYEIEEYEVSYIQHIGFIGRDAFRTSTLLDVVRSDERCWYCFLSSDDKFDAERVEYDKELLRKFYTSQGYADFTVNAESKMAEDKSGFDINFMLNEGRKYNFGKVNLKTGIQGADIGEMEDIVIAEEGELYNSEDVSSTVDNIIAEMGGRGFAFVDVRPKLARDIANNTVDVTFQVDEGRRVYVERINIKGNMRTLDEVVRREFRLVEGDSFSTAKLRRTEDRLRNLGFFNKVDIKRRRGSSDDRVVLDVTVEERSTGEVSVGAGYSTTDGALAELGISERNLLGRGQELRFKGMFAVKRQQFDIGFTEPYFLDRELSVGFDLFKTTQDFQSESAFDRESVGGRLRAGYAVTEHLKHNMYYSYEEVNISDVDATASRFIRDQEGSNVTSMIGHALVYDKRNNVYEPTEGWYLRASQDVAGLGGDSYFVRHEARSSAYVPIASGWTFMLASTAGHVEGYDDNNVRINDRFFLGGRTLRGFDNAGIGPRDKTTKDALGGNIYYTGTAELMFPLGLPEEMGFSGAAFVDAGSLHGLDVSDPNITDDRTIRASAGVGVAWKSPFGPVRIDFAKAFRKEDYDETEVFRFNFGTRF